MSIRNANGDHAYCCFDKCTEIGHTYIQPIQASRGPTTRHAFKTIDNRQVSVIIQTTKMLISTQKNADRPRITNTTERAKNMRISRLYTAC